jgi:hypothetical protein
LAGSAGCVVRVGLSPLPASVVAAWVQASCAAQGVPIKVTDPTILRRVGVLLGAVSEGPRVRKRSGTRGPSGSGSVTPLGSDAGGVHGLSSLAAGTDHDVIDQGFHDGVLPRQVQGVPRSA